MNSIGKPLEKIWLYLSGPELWETVFYGALKIIFIIIMAAIIIRIGKNLIERLFQSRKNGPLRISERREQTLKKLIQNILTYVVYFTAFVMILGVFSIRIGPLLAGAGIAGLAIGFGAQSLVKDIITGFFIIFEDQFSVGDYVIASGVEGTVEEIGLRTTKIQAYTGELNVIPNGSIERVTNYSIYNGLAIVDINIPYENDYNEAEKVIEQVCQTLPDLYEEIISVPEIIGVQTLELSHYVIRVIAETPPVYQWAGARVIRKEMKDQLYKAGIDIPSPRLVMYSRNEEPNGLEMQSRGESN